MQTQLKKHLVVIIDMDVIRNCLPSCSDSLSDDGGDFGGGSALLGACRGGINFGGGGGILLCPDSEVALSSRFEADPTP